MKKFLLFTFFITPFLFQAQVSSVKDINPGSGNGVGNELIPVNNKVLFVGNDGANGNRLWVSDGTLVNTLNVQIGSFSYNNPQNLFFFEGRNTVAFSAGFFSPMDNELYAYDANGNGWSFSNYNPSGSSNPNDFGIYYSGGGGTYLIFSIENPTTGRELAYTLPGGNETLIKDINPGAGSSNPKGWTYLPPNKYIFSADDGTNGNELWLSTFIIDTTTNLLLDINNGSSGSFPKNFILFNGKIYFTADDGTNGTELWVTDGTVAGTQMVLDIYSGATGSNPSDLTVYNNALYFSADHPTLGREIFKMTGAQIITNLKNIASGSGNGNPENLFVFNGTLYFTADDGVNGIELWSSTGFPSTTNLLKNINTSPSTPDSNPSGFAEYFGELYFAANDGVNGRELWKTDGTNAGTLLVSNINPSGDSNPADLIVTNNRLFFSANDGSTGIELWKYQDASLSIDDIELENSISLYPNPTKTSFSIETKEIISSVIVIDMLGKTVKTFKQSIETYSIDDLKSGLYFINITTEKGKVTKKLVKE